MSKRNLKVIYQDLLNSHDNLSTLLQQEGAASDVLRKAGASNHYQESAGEAEKRRSMKLFGAMAAG